MCGTMGAIITLYNRIWWRKSEKRRVEQSEERRGEMRKVER